MPAPGIRRTPGRNLIVVSPVLAVAVLLLCMAALACAAVALFYAVRKQQKERRLPEEHRRLPEERRCLPEERQQERQQERLQERLQEKRLQEERLQERKPEVRVVSIDANAGGAPPGTHPQVGYVVVQPSTTSASQSTAFALYGARSTTRAGRWNYYAIPPGAGGVKVPLHAGGRDCMDEVGCDLLFDGDQVSAPDAGVPAGIAKIYRSPITIQGQV